MTPWDFENEVLEIMYSKALQHIEAKDIPDISSYMRGVIETSLTIKDVALSHWAQELEADTYGEKDNPTEDTQTGI